MPTLLTMDTKQKEFIERRQAAHKAGTRDISRDPLVQAAMDMRRLDQEVMKRWKELSRSGAFMTWPAPGKRRKPRPGSQAE